MYSPVLSTMSAAALRSREPSTARELPLPPDSGQSLTIRYESVGSFHHWSYRFVFTADEVVIYNLETPAAIGRPHKLGAHRLSEKERITTRQLLGFCSGQKKSGCPTVDIIRFTKRDDRQRVHSITYVDITGCTLDSRKMLTLQNLAGRLLSKHTG